MCIASIIGLGTYMFAAGLSNGKITVTKNVLLPGLALTPSEGVTTEVSVCACV